MQSFKKHQKSSDTLLDSRVEGGEIMTDESIKNPSRPQLGRKAFDPYPKSLETFVGMWRGYLDASRPRQFDSGIGALRNPLTEKASGELIKVICISTATQQRVNKSKRYCPKLQQDDPRRLLHQLVQNTQWLPWRFQSGLPSALIWTKPCQRPTGINDLALDSERFTKHE